MIDSEMKSIVGGEYASNDCPTGKFRCFCDGKDYGCVSTVEECWGKC